MSRIPSRFVPSAIKRKYTVKFVVSILFVLVVIGSVGAYGYAQVDATTERDAEESLESSASMQADSLAVWTKGLDSQTKAIASSETLDRETEPQIHTGLHRDRVHHSDLTALHYFDAESGEMITSTLSAYREEGRSLEEIDEPWADPAIRDELNTNRAVWRSNTSYHSAEVGSRVMAFAVRDSTDPNKILVAEGTIGLRVQHLHQSGVNHSTAIMNTNGETVLGDEEREADIGDQPAVRAAIDRADENGTVQFEQHGDVLRAYAPVAGTDWVAVTSVPATDAYALRDAVGWNVMLIVFSGIVTLTAVGVVLGHQTVTPLVRLRRKAEQMREGDLEVGFETNRIDEIGQLFTAFDSLQTSLRARITETEAARDEVNRTNRHLESKADEYSTVMRACAEGDFTRRMDPNGENDAMTDVAREFNEMIAEIEETTEELKTFAVEVATASEEVTASTEEVRSASHQVTESVQAISVGSERQNESLQSVDYEMDGLASTIEEIAASSNEVADLAARTAHTGERGRNAADAAIEGMNEIESESERAVEEIEALETEIDRIDELLAFITEITEKTNMLALNANIEASRSSTGNGGHGFGVVALEIKELAAETKDATKDIEALTSEIKDQTHRTATEVQQTSKQVAEHREAVENTVDALAEIANYAQETNDGVQDISAASEQQAASTEEVVAMVDNASTISEETAAEAETVAAAAQEQTSSLTEVSQSIVDLAQQASQLSEELEQFHTGNDRDEFEFTEGDENDGGDGTDGENEDANVDESGRAGSMQ